MRLGGLKRWLASRAGVAVMIVAICAIAAGGMFRIWRSFHDIAEISMLLDDQLTRDIMIAATDLSRLAYVVNRTALEGDMTPDLRRDYETALDMMFVRVDSILRNVRVGDTESDVLRLTGTLTRLAELADAELLDGFPDPVHLSREFATGAEVSRSQISRYLDVVRNAQILSMARHLDALWKVTSFLIALIAVMAAFGVTVTMLLRAEATSRRRHQLAEAQARFLALNDPLTGLANRTGFYEWMDQLFAEDRAFALLVFDLDDFKGINDTYGHGTGDEVLTTLATRLEVGVVPLNGLVARLGGDEFAALVPLDAGVDPDALCAGLLVAAAEPMRMPDATIFAHVSIGLAVSTDVGLRELPSPEALMRAADYALYDAKLAGRDTFRTYDTVLAARLAERRATLDAIPASILRNEFYPVYQPKVILATGEIFGYEALIRWRRGEEEVSPAEFLTIAEDSRLILDLDLFMLTRVTAQVARWNAGRPRPVGVSINLSARHFDGDRIVGQVSDALRDSGLDPALLTLEITETVLIGDWDGMSVTLGALKALGVDISLDDFGTGYSSLSYLRKLTVDEVKLDRSFLTDIEGSAQTRFILDALIDLISSLGMRLVVEGVETQAQARILGEFGVTMVQGYLFGKPTRPVCETQPPGLDPVSDTPQASARAM